MSTHQTPEPPSDAARPLLDSYIQLLGRKLMTRLPNAKLCSPETGWRLRLGDVVLRVAPVQPTQFRVTDFEDTYVPLRGSLYSYRSPFIVKVKSSIAVIDGNANEKSYDLWYCNAQEPTIFGWYGVYSNNTKMIPIKEDNFVDQCVDWLERTIQSSPEGRDW